MAIVEIYSSVWCPFCYRAKRLLEQKGVDYKEIEVSDNPNLKSEMLATVVVFGMNTNTNTWSIVEFISPEWACILANGVGAEVLINR